MQIIWIGPERLGCEEDLDRKRLASSQDLPFPETNYLINSLWKLQMLQLYLHLRTGPRTMIMHHHVLLAQGYYVLLYIVALCYVYTSGSHDHGQ